MDQYRKSTSGAGQGEGRALVGVDGALARMTRTSPSLGGSNTAERYRVSVLGVLPAAEGPRANGTISPGVPGAGEVARDSGRWGCFSTLSLASAGR